MKYLKYVPPEIVAKEAREILTNRHETPEEHWQRLIQSGLIRVLENGEVEVCFERPDEEPPKNGNGTGS
jgi:hypothetical protein